VLECVPHRLQLHLLIGGQLILDANCHPHVEGLDFTFGIQHLVKLRQRQLLVHLITLHGFVQRFHGILKLPLKIIKATGGALLLVPHECLLRIGQSQLALMLHDHVQRKHVTRQRIVRRPRLARLHLRLIAIDGLPRWRRLLLRRREQAASQNNRDQNHGNHEDSLTHFISPYRSSAQAKTISFRSHSH
jgi:hypothetical protein